MRVAQASVGVRGRAPTWQSRWTEAADADFTHSGIWPLTDTTVHLKISAESVSKPREICVSSYHFKSCLTQQHPLSPGRSDPNLDLPPTIGLATRGSEDRVLFSSHDLLDGALATGAIGSLDGSDWHHYMLIAEFRPCPPPNCERSTSTTTMQACSCWL